ncbi:AAA family ATPase [Streptomyces sp. NPDC050560]|uniref:AAA family ATPase n=1 Tax=Streptomyces sp. NPDC050560 TaxID=3365630 RepID=UPI0037B2E584
MSVTAPDAAATTAMPGVWDLRGRPGAVPAELWFDAGDLVVVSGLPGSGKSTLIRRTVRTATGVMDATATAGTAATGAHGAHRLDSQDVRERFARRVHPSLPYALYRPLVRLAHYARLLRALRSGRGLVVHDCGNRRWVRALLACAARRRGGALHLLLLDVAPDAALAGQHARGRRVSRHAFGAHRRAFARLLERVAATGPPPGCASVLLFDRTAADTVRTLGFRR